MSTKSEDQSQVSACSPTARLRGHYDSYWSQDRPPPVGDPTTPERKQRLKHVLKQLPPGARVLDLGCGNGQFAAYIRGLGCQAEGMDLSAVALKIASESYPDVRFSVIGEDGKILSADGAYDVVWSSEVLEHVFDVHHHLSEINRILRNSGLYVLTTPYHGLVKNLAIVLFNFGGHFNPEGDHIRFFDWRSLRHCLRRAGFEVMLRSGIGRVWPLYRSWFVVAKKVGPIRTSR